MSKLLAALLAAGFGLGLNAATALDIKSDQFKADRQEQIVQQKEQGVDASDGNASAPTGRSAEPDLRSQQIPPQSLPSVGHPQEGAATGQFGVKKFNEEESGQLDQSTSGMSDQDSSRQTDKRITPN